MRIGCFDACACVSYCYETAKQVLSVTVLKLNDIKHSPEAFQKACIIALSIIRAINYQYNTHYLSHFITVLDSAPAFDFYAFCKLPRYLLHPYYPERFDEYDLLDQLEVILCDNWHLGIPDEHGQNRDPVVQAFAQDELTAFLETMLDNQLDFSTEEEVKTILHNWLEKRLETNPENDDFDPHNINLQDLKINLKTISWLEYSIIFSLTFADIACVPDFLQIWELVDLAPYTHAMGQVPILSYATQYAIGDWVWGALCTGFTLQFINAAQDLWNGNLSPQEAKDAKWIMVASIAESVYCFANLQHRDPKLINCLALVAKSLGLIAFLSASRPTFFTAGEDAFAAEEVLS